METWITEVSRHVALLVEAMAMVIIAVSSLTAFVGSARLFLGRQATEQEKRTLWLRYARWLVAALTFQLGADLVSTAISPTWDDIGRLGAIAVIRTFLSYFLERDVAEQRDLLRENGEASTNFESRSDSVRTSRAGFGTATRPGP